MSGSGSTFLHGFMEDNYKPTFSREYAKEFLRKCIALAVYKDASSGGCCRILDITPEKVTREFFEFASFPIK